jgi:hypothetical protein
MRPISLKIASSSLFSRANLERARGGGKKSFLLQLRIPLIWSPGGAHQKGIQRNREEGKGTLAVKKELKTSFLHERHKNILYIKHQKWFLTISLRYFFHFFSFLSGIFSLFRRVKSTMEK